MTDVWLAIPSAAPPEKANPVLDAWRAFGCKVAVFLDDGSPDVHADLMLRGEYKGYPAAVKTLCDRILQDESVQIICTGGDDLLPDLRYNAAKIAEEFLRAFPDTFGVLQPTGDRWMPDESGRAASERICGSPWMGRSFIRRINGGLGPFWPEYRHFYCDQEMKEVCDLLGILWQRPDIDQKHLHWSRLQQPRPPYLNDARLDWKRAKQLFERRQVAQFPGHQPLGVGVLA